MRQRKHAQRQGDYHTITRQTAPASEIAHHDQPPALACLERPAGPSALLRSTVGVQPSARCRCQSPRCTSSRCQSPRCSRVAPVIHHSGRSILSCGAFYCRGGRDGRKGFFFYVRKFLGPFLRHPRRSTPHLGHPVQRRKPRGDPGKQDQDSPCLRALLYAKSPSRSGATTDPLTHYSRPQL